MIRFRTAFLLSLAVLLAAVMSTPFTEPGTRLLLGLANRVSFLDIAYSGGSLAGSLQLEHVHVQTETLDVLVSAVEADFIPACIWRSVVCLDRLQAEEVSVSLVNAEEPAAPRSPGELLQWPFAIEAGQVDVSRVTVNWPGGHWRQGAISGRVELVESIIRVEAASLENAELLIEASGDNKSMAAEKPGWPEISLPLELQVGELQLTRSRFIIAGVEREIDQLNLTGRWRREELSLQELLLETPEGNLALEGTLAFRQGWPVHATASLDGLAISPVDISELRGRLSGDFAQAKLQVEASGGAGINLDADVDFMAPGMPFKGVVSLLLPGDQYLDGLLPLPEILSGAALDGPLEARFEGDLESQRFELDALLGGTGYEQLNLQLQGGHRESTVDIESMSLRDEASGSALLVQGAVRLEETLAVKARFSTEGLSLPRLEAVPQGRIVGGGQVDAEITGDVWALSLADLELAGEINELPAMLSGKATVSSGLKFSNTRLQGQVNSAVLHIDAPEAAGGDLVAELQLEDLALWHREARGSLQLTARRDAANNTFIVDGRAMQLSLSGLSAASGSLYGTLSGDESTFSLALGLQAPGYDGAELEALQLTAEGDLSTHRVRLVSRGNIEGTLEVTGGQSSGAWKGELAPTRLISPQGAWSLDKAVAMRWQPDVESLQLAGHCWQHSEFGLCFGEAQLGATGSGSLEVSGDVSALNGLIPSDLELTGSLDIQAEAAWSSGDAPRLKAVTRTRDFTVTRHFGLGDSVTVSWDQFITEIDQGGEGLALQSALVRSGRKVFTADLQVSPGPEQALQGVVRLDELELYTAAPWAPELSRLDGQLSGDISLGGTVAQPRLEGFLALSQGNLALEGNPTQVSDLEMQLKIMGDSAQLSGHGLLGGGEIQVDGLLSTQPGWQLELTAVGKNHQVLLPPSAEMRVSEELSLKVIPGLIDVSGDIRVHEGVLHHEQLPEGSVALSPDVVEVDLAGNPLLEESPWKIRSDVWIHIRDRFEVKGESLLATVGGDLHLRGEPDRPLQVFGNLNIVGGELRAYNQQLVIRRGTVAFSGPPGDPELDIRAEREIRDQGITVGATLQGRLSEPALGVYSEPPMPQGETMSYLVRGRGLDSGAGADGTALALAMGADVVNRSGIVSSINQIPGISNVSFGSTGTEDDTAATVSGYLGERIYLSYGLGLYEPINVLTARLYLQTRLWLEVVSRLENSFDIYYSFDID